MAQDELKHSGETKVGLIPANYTQYPNDAPAEDIYDTPLINQPFVITAFTSNIAYSIITYPRNCTLRF